MTSNQKEEQVETMVFQYLKSKGYKSLNGADGRTMTLDDKVFDESVTAETIQQSLLHFGSYKELTPEQYSASYVLLRDWVQSSLDMYKAELATLLFPIFVHCFLDMLKRGWTMEAGDFLNAHEREHMMYSAEIAQLKGRTKDNVEQSEFAKTNLLHKMEVRICSYSFNLLIDFCQKNDLLIILGMINQRVDVQVTGSNPTDHIEERTTTYLGVSVAKQQAVNKASVAWGQIEPMVRYQKMAFQEKVAEAEKAAEAEAAAARERGEEPPPFKKPKWTDPPDMAKTVVLGLHAVDVATERKMVEDIKLRAPLSPTDLPSIAFYTFLNTHSSLNHVEVSRDGSLVAGCFADSQIKLWDLNALEENQAGGQVLPHSLLVGHAGAVYNASFSVDMQYMVSCSADSTVRLWGMDKKRQLVVYKGHNYPVWDVKFSPLGYYFVSCSHDRTARLWTTDRISPVRIFAGHIADVDTCEFHPNCNYVATGSSDKSVRLWDVNSGSCVRLFTGHTGPVSTLAFSPNGKYLASSGEDKQVIIWDIASGKRVRALQGHQKTVWSLDFSNEGTLLASGSADNTVRLWNTSSLTENDKNSRATLVSNELIKTFPTKATPGMTVKFTRRNLLLAAGGFAA